MGVFCTDTYASKGAYIYTRFWRHTVYGGKKNAVKLQILNGLEKHLTLTGHAVRQGDKLSYKLFTDTSLEMDSRRKYDSIFTHNVEDHREMLKSVESEKNLWKINLW